MIPSVHIHVWSPVFKNNITLELEKGPGFSLAPQTQITMTATTYFIRIPPIHAPEL